MKRALPLLLLVLCGCRPVAPPRAVTAAAPVSAGQALETLTLAPGQAGSTRAVLARGQLYLVKAAGPAPLAIDAGEPLVLPALGRKPAPPSGRPLAWVASHAGRFTILTGAGTARTLRNQGAAPVTLTLWPLTPPPPALGAPVETVLVPAREKVAVRSEVRPPRGAIYLLQAVGEVQVGGAGNLGDAEFHDYKADGSGFNEGEAGVDFGIGVDEPVIPDSTTGPAHPQRRAKWGAFRRDHTYYLLYAGTGERILFNYHDSGGRSGIYKDNDGFLPVSIFALP